MTLRGEGWAVPVAPAVDGGRQVARELDTMDRAVYQAIGSVTTPRLDKAMVRLSNAASHSRLWLSCATIMAALGGGPGRRAALLGVVSVGFSSAVSNLVVKPLWARRRPERPATVIPMDRWVRMPTSAVHALRTQRLGVRLRHRGRVRTTGPLDTVARGRHSRRVLASAHRRALPSRRDRGVRDRHEHGRLRLPHT